MTSEIPPFLGCSLHKRSHGCHVCKHAQAISPTRLDPSFAVDLHCDGLSLLPWPVLVLDRESRISNLDNFLASHEGSVPLLMQ